MDMGPHQRHSGDSSGSHAPDPYRPDIPRAALDKLTTADERHRVISEAAYFIAESRGFAPGHEFSDWLAAETEVNRVSGLIEPAPRWDE